VVRHPGQVLDAHACALRKELLRRLRQALLVPGTKEHRITSYRSLVEAAQ